MRLTKSKKFKEDDGRKLKKQFLRDFKRGAKGITLVALVVTIIVLLILAGVAISLTVGDNGLFRRAQNAADTYEQASKKEKIELAIGSTFLDETGDFSITKSKLENALRGEFGNDTEISVEENGDGSFLITIDNKNEYYVGEDGELIDSSNMIKISTADELKAFRDDVNSGNTYEGKYVYLANDITLDINEEWEPIGIYQQDSTNSDDETNIPFKGIFDGCFNTISGIYTNSSLKNRGLFGLIKEATIKNLGIVNGNIHGTSRTGAVVGYAYQNSKITNCYNSSDINSTDNFVGGIAGFVKDETIIESCYNIGNITTSNTNIGGIVGGIQNATIKNCYNTGMIEGISVGGISGIVYTGASIENCYNIGNLKAMTIALSINTSSNQLVTFKNNYYLENTVNESNDIYPQEECKVKNSQEMKELYSTLGDAYKEDTDNINNGYPILNWQ